MSETKVVMVICKARAELEWCGNIEVLADRSPEQLQRIADEVCESLESSEYSSTEWEDELISWNVVYPNGGRVKFKADEFGHVERVVR